MGSQKTYSSTGTGDEIMHTCRYHLHNLFYNSDPLDYLSVNETEIKLSLENSVESRWRALKRFLENGLVEFGQFKECHTGELERTYGAVLSKMEELEEK